MDITQLLITAGSVLGIVLVGAMAVVPAAMEAWSGRRDAPVAPAPTPLRPARRLRHHHHSGHLAA